MTLFFIIYQTIHVEFCLVDSVLFLVLKKPLISFNVLGVQKIRSHLFLIFVRIRSRREVCTQTQSSSLMFVSPSCSEFTIFVCAPFYRIFFYFSGSGRLRKCENSPFGQSAFPCFCELAFFSIVLSASLSALGKKAATNRDRSRRSGENVRVYHKRGWTKRNTPPLIGKKP